MVTQIDLNRLKGPVSLKRPFLNKWQDLAIKKNTVTLLRR